MRANRVYLRVKQCWGYDRTERAFSVRSAGRSKSLQSFFTLTASAFVFVVAVSSAVITQPVKAAGVGAADVNSMLGAPLSIDIPIFNVVNPAELRLSVSSRMFDADPNKKLQVSLERGNNQLAARVFTDWDVMEPYVEFTLELQDGGVQQNKDFIVLLDFSPSTLGGIDPLRVPEQQSTSGSARQPVVTIQRIEPVVSQSSDVVRTDSTMGPYDWAEPGAIPTRFGAVLDGQSLWRVARRINTAMGVSVEQMMVALYNANRSAFLTDSINSLKAGSFLTIPEQEVVAALSRSQAELQVERLSAANPSIESSVDASEEAVTITDNTPSEEDVEQAPVAEAVTEVAPQDEPLFVIGESDVLSELELTPIQDSAAQELPAEVNQIDPSANQVNTEDQQSIIDSLSRTIGDLMRDNVDKEQRILLMDERLRALEDVMDNLDLATTSGLASVTKTAEPEAQPMRWWLWILPFAVVGAGWFGYRYYREAKTANLNLFVEPSPPVAPLEEELDEFDDQPVSSFKDYPTNTDFSPMRSHTSRHPQEGDDLEGVSYEEIDEDYSEPEMTSGTLISDDTIEFDTSNIRTFPGAARKDLLEAIEEFIAERDFVAACGALEKARGSELDEPNYHFQMLRILLEKDDEHGFYEYFNTVENKFVDVDRELKMNLANLVSRLNQQG